MPTIHIPTPLRPYVDKHESVEVPGTTVREALANLTATYGELRKHLYNDEGKLRSFVNIYLNDEDIRYLQKEDTTLQAEDALSIIPSVAGGAPTAPAAPPATERELPTLSAQEYQRYSRHLILPEVGLEGQRKLKAAKVLCVGAGGLGSPVALYLAAAGVGTIGIVDFDVVDLSNLQRQIIHTTADIGRPKLESAKAKINAMNPEVKVLTYGEPLSSKNALEIFRGYDVILDGTDNFPTRYLVNDACVLLGIPNAYGSIFRFEGQASVFGSKDGPCYRCLYPEPPPPGLVPSCAEGGVLGVLPGIIGMIQATEAVKIILGIGEPLIGRFMIYDALKMRFRELKLRKDPDCPVCGTHPTVTALIDYEQFCGVPAVESSESPVQAPPSGTVPGGSSGRATSVGPGGVPEMTATELKAWMDENPRLQILDVREPFEAQISRIDGATLIPLGELQKRYAELDPSRDLVVHCKIGGRSAKAVSFLKDHGFPQAINLKGGILAWSDQVDPSQPKY
jgi:molybdopterin/thiamine biosynthesis adenylyltransferase/rhodanese-related sulfurtransferase/molybdopterin converting factor small subunit